MSTDEPELIAHILDGDTEAYRELVDRHKNALFRHCFYIMRDEDLAEDMAQEAFVRAYEQLTRFDAAKGSFKTWLTTIATRLCLQYLRRDRTVPLDYQDLLESRHPTPIQDAVDQELHDAVLRLKPQYRTVISLHYWQGYSYEDIAVAMDVPVGSVRGWLHRAKKQLKEALS
jgi:RNA polymerase sigma-70 factor, ECF subfamily